MRELESDTMSVGGNWIFCSIPKDTLYSIDDEPPEIRSGSRTVFKVNLKQTWEEVLEACLKHLSITDVVWIPSKDQDRVQVYFPVKHEEHEVVLNFLGARGFGTASGTTLAFIPFTMFFQEEEDEAIPESGDDDVFDSKPAKGVKTADDRFKNKLVDKLTTFKKIQEDFLRTVTSRLTVAQVVSGVKNSSKVTFDFVMYTFLAGCIASCGIMNDAVTDIAAAMCIEPVMATVLVGSFGTIVRDASLIKMGIRNNCIVNFECIITGFLYGLIAMIWSEEWDPPAGHWPTNEMVGRSMYKSLVMGALQASAAGGAVALGLLSNNYTALVGVAIASTFLPHATNTGLLWAWICHLSWRGMNDPLVERNVTAVSGGTKMVWTKDVYLAQPGYEPIYSYDMRWECMNLSYVSLLNCYINVVCLYIGCTLVLILKEVAPLGSFEPNLKFFQEDIKAYRNYVSKGGVDGGGSSYQGDNLGSQILREWATITGLNADTLLSNRPEAKITQIQTLADLVLEVENDKNYLSVTRAAPGIPEPNLLRRLTHGSISFNPGGSQQHIQGLDNAAFVRSMEGLNNISTQATVHGNLVSNVRKRFSRNRARGDSVLVKIPDARISESSITSTQGLTPEELEMGSRTSVFLKKTLNRSNHSPYSLWPTGRRPSCDPRINYGVSSTSLNVSPESIGVIRQRKSNSSTSSFSSSPAPPPPPS